MKLEEIQAGSLLTGVVPGEAVKVISAEMRGSDALQIFWAGAHNATGIEVLYRAHEERLGLEEEKFAWNFEADGEELKLASEALRIHYAHLFDPYLAVHNSDVQPLPHQITAVYQEMLPRLPLRFVLADDPGAGKTVMTGLLIKELIARGDLAKCLIVCPGSLVEQWRDELYDKFGLNFEILTNERFESVPTGNAFEEARYAIMRLDKLARDDSLLEKLDVTEWDLVVCDEAHKMSVQFSGDEIQKTARYRLGERLSRIAHNFLLLTATPHNGIEKNFQAFLALIDPDRFLPSGRLKQRVNPAGVIRRLVKEDLLKFDGTPLFPERDAETLSYALSPLEAELYEKVTDYVQQEFNRADKLDRQKSRNVGFALTVLQRRLASSPEAILRSITRRAERLEKRLSEMRNGGGAQNGELPRAPDYDWDDEDFASGEIEEIEDAVADQASAAANRAELEAEIRTLRQLEELATRVRNSGTDRKWEGLSGLLQEKQRMFSEEGVREKLLIFTEHRDTLNYLADKIRSLLGRPEEVVTIHGGMNRAERRRAEAAFRNERDARVLIATDAAGEGINLQNAHLMVNYDLPWNPNRLEQRFGRIHRIGQDKKCWLWNLVATQTREGDVFGRLLEKLKQQKESLGGKVFDILGRLTFGEHSLRDLLIMAVRNNDAAVRTRIQGSIDAALTKRGLDRLVADHALCSEILNMDVIQNTREEMERAAARRLQPHYIHEFFSKAFGRFKGELRKREPGRYEITYVPSILRNIPVSGPEPVVKSYERVCFDKSAIGGDIRAALLCTGHPLLESLLSATLDKYGHTLRQGAVLVDRNDPGEVCRVLFYIESAIVDGTRRADGSRREISRRFFFVELGENGFAANRGHAPYLDYAAADPEEREQALRHIRNLDWLRGNLEQKASKYAFDCLVPGHFEEQRRIREERVARTIEEVDRRLKAEISALDYRVVELEEQERQGRRNARLNSVQARRRKEELAQRRKKRLAELENERKISPLPPEISGACLIVPGGLLARLLPHKAGQYAVDQAAREAVERAAMNAVMRLEEKLGYAPRDVSQDKCGYDIESMVPPDRRGEGGHALRKIEVKGRQKGADTIRVTKNEVLCGLTASDSFILAIVEVDGDVTRTTYIKNPFEIRLDNASCSSEFVISELLRQGEVIYSES